ncbi:ParA family protein [Streptomyces diastaticus]
MAVDGLDTIAEVSEKGGVGKTSVTSGMAAVAAEWGLRVGVADLDPRCTLTDEMGITDPERSVNDIFYTDSQQRPRDPAEIAREVLVRAGPAWPSNVFVLPCIREFGNRETDPATGMEFRLKRALWGLREDLDLVLMDVPPRPGGKIAGAALIATRKVVIPATLTNDGWSGAVEAIKTIEHFNTPGGLNEDLELSCIVRSIVPRDGEMRQIHYDWQNRLLEDFGDLVLPTVLKNYAVREVARTACAPITAAPGREAKLLVSAYGEILTHALPDLKEKR